MNRQQRKQKGNSENGFQEIFDPLQVQNIKDELSGSEYIQQFRRQTPILLNISQNLQNLKPQTKQSITASVTSEKFKSMVEQKQKELSFSNAQKNMSENKLQKIQNNAAQNEETIKQLAKNYQQRKMKLIQSHQKEIEQKNQQIEKLESNITQEIKKRQSMKQRWEYDRQEIKLQLSQKQQEINQLNVELEKLNEQNKNMKAEIFQLNNNNANQENTLNGAQKDIQKLRKIIKDYEDKQNKRAQDLKDVYRSIPQDKKTKSRQVSNTQIIETIKITIQELNYVRNSYKEFNSQNFLKTIEQVLQFWKNYNKKISNTIQTLDLIKRNKAKADEMKKIMNYKFDFIENFSEAIGVLRGEIQQKTTLIQENEKKLSNIQEQLNTQKKQKQKLLKKSKLQIDESKKEIVLLNDLKSQLEKKNQELKKNISDLQKGRQELKAALANEKAKVNKLQKDIQNLKLQLGQVKNEKINIQSNYSKQKKTHNELKQEHDKLKKAHDELKKANSELKKGHDELKKMHDELKQAHNKVKQEHQRQINNHKKTKIEAQSKINQLEKHVQKCLIDINNKQEKIAQLKLKLQKETIKYKKEIEQALKNKNELSEKLTITERQLENAILKGKKTDEIFRNVIKKACGYEVPISIDPQKLGQQCSRMIISKNFVSGSQTMEKLSFRSINTLINTIERKRGRSVKGLKPVYKYDNLNTINFHNYIDNKTDLLMIARLINEYVVGGYTHQPINKVVTPGIGFIFSFSEARDIILEINPEKSTARVVTPQDYQAIFGNSQLRINQNDTDIFCNVGILSENFNANSQNIKATDFIGTQTRDQKSIKMQTYEFYQVQFD